MKKTTKRLLSLLMAVVLCVGLCVPAAFAGTITVPSTLTGHTFVAYQIFTGDQTDDDTTGALANVEWGSGINDSAFLDALKANATLASIFAECDDAADVAAALKDVESNSTDAEAIAKIAFNNKKAGSGMSITSGTTVLDSGYYLIVDSTDLDDDDDANNAALLFVTKSSNLTLTDKHSKPSVEKKVYENVKYDQDGGYGTHYNDVADYNMGDTVPFVLIGTVPDMSKYDTYLYIFHDTMSSGLTLDADSIEVYLSNDKVLDKSDTDITSDFTKVTSGADLGTESFTVSTTDLKSVNNKSIKSGQFIIVYYEAELNQNAKVGLPGNPNEVYLEYSNNPNDEGTGKTTDDKVIVFTYEVDVTKVNDDTTSPTQLTGAEFVLYRENSSGVKEYALMNTNGKVVDWTTSDPYTTNDKTGAIEYTTSNGATTQVYTDATNAALFKITGLDDGTYYLKETVAPSGYELPSTNVTINVTATTINGQTYDEIPANALTKIENAKAGDTTRGITAVDVTNTKGTALPSTGGIGTTIFYVVGGGLMLGALVLLITKKRMSGEE